MGRIESRGLANIEFILRWKSSHASHIEHYYAKKVNFWRDIIPVRFRDLFMGKEEGERVLLTEHTGDIVAPYDPGDEFDLALQRFDRHVNPALAAGPRFGRFYPRGILKGLSNIFPGNVEPFRCVGLAETQLRVDLNHPLAAKPAELSAAIDAVAGKSGDLGGSCNDWMEVVSAGPGMQARCTGLRTDFFSDNPFTRADENDDAVFYDTPRLVTHLDEEAIGIVKGIYGGFLKYRMRALDLMSSWRSHIPENLSLKSLVGLGLNGREMEENEQLSDFLIHDLNRDYHLPFENCSFDAVICTVSVEYLTRPFRIFEEVARILMPGGIFVVTFSNRWFPPKAIRIWAELHEFERIGLVLEYFLHSGKFSNLSTYSMRGRPRPFSDKHFIETQVSDPVYAVFGQTESEVSNTECCIMPGSENAGASVSGITNERRNEDD
jgi:hypothetical protein